MRDNCVRVPHLSETIAGINRNIDTLGRMEDRLQRIEEKLDKQLQGHQQASALSWFRAPLAEPLAKETRISGRGS